jgi:hypothetical protein
MMAIACHNERRELADRAADDEGLVGHENRVDTKRQIGRDLVHGASDILSQREDIPALAHGDGNADRRFPVHPEHGLRRIGVDPSHFSDVGEAEQAAVRRDVDAQDVQLGLE